MLQDMKVRSATVLVAAATFITAACAGERDAAYDTTVAGGDVMGADTSAAAMSGMSDLPTTDAGVVQFVTTVDQGEVEVGELAQNKATNADVKAYARMLVTDHRNDRQQIQNIQQNLQDTTALATSSAISMLQSEHQQTMNRLQNLSGAEFDRAFIDEFDRAFIEAMVNGHQKVIDALRQMQNRVQNEQLRQQLTQTTSTVQKHLDRAREIQNKLGGTTTDTARSN